MSNFFSFLHMFHVQKFEISPHDSFFSPRTSSLCPWQIWGMQAGWSMLINEENKQSSAAQLHTSYLSRTQGRCPWRKNLSCGEISNFCTWNMWRKLKFLHKWINFKFFHMTDVEKSEISFVVCTIYGILLHFTLFCCQICFFWRFSLFCRIIGFSDLRTIMWRKI